MESPDMIYVDLCEYDIPNEIMKDGVDLCDDDDIDDIPSSSLNLEIQDECEDGEFVPSDPVTFLGNGDKTTEEHKVLPRKYERPYHFSAKQDASFCLQKNKKPFNNSRQKRNGIFLQKNAERKKKAILEKQERLFFQEKQRNSILDRQVVEFSRALYAVFPGIGCNIDNFAVAIRNFMIDENFGPDFIARSALLIHRISGAILQLPDIVRYLR